MSCPYTVEQISYYPKAYDLVDSFFNDNIKTQLWLSTDNPGLGGVSPKWMLASGRGEKLLQFIKDSLDENIR